MASWDGEPDLPCGRGWEWPRPPQHAACNSVCLNEKILGEVAVTAGKRPAMGCPVVPKAREYGRGIVRRDADMGILTSAGFGQL
jgi:hypothetical protein